MSDEQKKFAVEALHGLFVDFMNKVSKIPGSMIQKQQAFLRFDEGHMWMQNAVLTFTPPAQPQPVAADPVPEMPPTPAANENPEASVG